MRAPIRGKATMSDLQARFEQAKQDVQGLSERPDNDTLLRLYALYKQGSEGDVSGPKPGFFDFVATAKYRSEEHTSELQSLMRISYAVFSLKKTKNNNPK